MFIRSCRFLLPSQPRRPHLRLNRHSSRGQILVIFGVALIALMLFVGLAVDAGSLYVTYGQLKRSVDAAAVAAANEYKRTDTQTTITAIRSRIETAAYEVLKLNNIDPSSTNVVVHLCGDPNLEVDVPTFYARCPRTDLGELPRKYIWLDASMRAPTYFLSLLGFGSINLHTDSMAEAATVDLVIVIDTSESMAQECQTFDLAGNCVTPKSPNFVPNDYDPDAAGNCNTTNPTSCHPLQEAKEAAKTLVKKALFDGYDRVAVVTFATMAETAAIKNKNNITVQLSDDLCTAEQPGCGGNDGAVIKAIDGIMLHDDAPYNRLWPTWTKAPNCANKDAVTGKCLDNTKAYNPVNPEDRDGDGADYDNPTKLGYTCPSFSNPANDAILSDRWWSTAEGAPDPFGWGGVPCDSDTLLDAFNWDNSHNGPSGAPDWTAADQAIGEAWVNKMKRDPDGPGPAQPFAWDSVLSTCTGCGVRVASNILRSGGRPNAVWVIVFLTDGTVNLSDIPSSNPKIPVQYPIGFCNGKLTNNSGQAMFWKDLCVDKEVTTRYCIDNQASSCPSPLVSQNDITQPRADDFLSVVTHLTATPDNRYSPYDYALDMIDEAALTQRTNPNEPIGNDIAIYTIALGAVSDQAELMMRYMAAVGDDGNRLTDPCEFVSKNKDCGQYYYAVNGGSLLPIFENIASRIYTRISE